MSSPWTEIEACLEGGDYRGALARLLALWKEQPSKALADLLDAVTTEAKPAALAGKTVMQRREAWDKRVRSDDLLDVPVLAEALLPFGALPASDRLKKLLARGSDPRLTKILLAWAAERPNKYQGRASEDFWRLVAQALASTRDRRALQGIEALLGSIGRSYHADHVLKEVLPGVHETLKAVPEVACPEAEALLARLSLPPSRPVVDTKALLDAVYADPSSDEARLVLADALQEAGDPRGEFIALQMKSKLTREQRRRMRELEEEHHKEWLGPLALVVRKAGRRFERGFLTACRISGHSDVKSLEGVRELATVEELDLAEYGTRRFFETTPLRALRKLEGRCYSIFEAQCELPVRVLSGILYPPMQGVADTLLRCTSLPKLEALSISTGFEEPEQWRATLASPFARPLRRLSLGIFRGSLGAWRRVVREAAPHIERLWLGVPTTSLCIEPGRVTLERDVSTYEDGGALSSGTLARPRAITQLLEMLASDALEPSDVLVVRLVRGRFAPKPSEPVAPAEIEAIREAAARFASVTIEDCYDVG